MPESGGMKSIRELYKIGKGPSSSHTIGPERAARRFRETHPDADAFQVRLYESLCKTGKGHGTDRVLHEVLSPIPTDAFCKKSPPTTSSIRNTMEFLAFQGRGGREYRPRHLRGRRRHPVR